MIRCSRCVMDNKSDVFIEFDESGQCNYCTTALEEMETIYFPGEEGKTKLNALIKTVKEAGRGKKYDCIMGLSGGLDSSYLAYLGYKWGLRVLAIHVDDGFDTQISKRNIKSLVDKTGFDYLVIKPDSYQYNELTKAFMRAGVPNIVMPQDNILFAYLYSCAKRYKIKHFLSGGNFALESILQEGNTHSAYDVVNIKDINSRFGKAKLSKLKFISTIRSVIDRRILGIQSLRPLNLIDYNKERAFAELAAFCGFEYYGGKHLENSLTEFAQLYWFPKKFNVDKRTSHLSSMIISGQLTREEALKELEKPLYNQEQMEDCINEIKSKLGIADHEFDSIMASPVNQHTVYRTEEEQIRFRLFMCLSRIKRFFQRGDSDY